ncbi:MAG: tetratricopeptide repeat protein [Elusimicrobiota bacterium]
MTRRTGILAAALLLAAAALRAETPQELFDLGNRAYEQGQFAAARDRYEDVLRRGWGGAGLYYNLGNAYYRLGRLGRARLWYERASAADPSHEDARHNLALIRAQWPEEAPPGFLEGKEAAAGWIFLAANFFFFLLMAAGLYSRAEWVWWGRWTAAFLFLAAAGLLLFSRSQGRRPAGIVLEARAEARAGPGPEFRVGFVVPEGRKVILFGRSEGWREIGVPDQGLKGWVPQEAVEPIAPSSAPPGSLTGERGNPIKE